MNSMSFSVCAQCGFSHPAIPSGEKCPMAKEKSPSGQVIEYDNFLITLKNILTSQIQKKDIKNIEKFLGNMIVKITLLAEEYKE